MLFVIFVLVIPITVWVILHFMTREKSSGESPAEEVKDVCALCHQEFQIDRLLEKEVGEYGRIYCFCGACIKGLSREYEDTREQHVHAGPEQKASGLE